MQISSCFFLDFGERLVKLFVFRVGKCHGHRLKDFERKSIHLINFANIPAHSTD